MKINSLKILFGLVTLLASAASEAIAQNPVTVRFDPQNTTVTAGDSFTVKLVADIPAPVVGWGLDVGFDSALLSLESVEVGPAWHAATAADGDSLAGLVFPSPVSGQNTLLATLHLKAKVRLRDFRCHWATSPMQPLSPARYPWSAVLRSSIHQWTSRCCGRQITKW